MGVECDGRRVKMRETILRDLNGQEWIIEFGHVPPRFCPGTIRRLGLSLDWSLWHPRLCCIISTRLTLGVGPYCFHCKSTNHANTIYIPATLAANKPR